jgi:hypothetical protein
MISGLSCSVTTTLSSDSQTLTCSTGFVVTDDQLFGVTQDGWDALFGALLLLWATIFGWKQIAAVIKNS